MAAVVLAAGISRRLGEPKQKVHVGGMTLLERAVCTASLAGLAPVLVVVEDPRLLPDVQRWGGVGVLNDQTHEGMAASIRYGVRAVDALRSSGVVVMPCDQVGITPDHLQLLFADESRVTASEYAGHKGVPAYFPRASFPALMKLRGDVGARDLLRDAVSVVDERLALDIDTQEDLARALELYGE